MKARTGSKEDEPTRVDNLSLTMLSDVVKGMLELVTYKHIRTNYQKLYTLEQSFSSPAITGLGKLTRSCVQTRVQTSLSFSQQMQYNKV
ncbi:hypothetical protein GN958_ATG08224 [Phytophthora infestans]|uniref:Uncharacterized protein n=1 Tax=Phytophthora infestans TaxID=4787 RepID=A0A8S9UU18_PHYIN|nr:hypothetical protein GN958_ATG08224 [Phytophthora infestans]